MHMDASDLCRAKRVYENGENVIEYLRNHPSSKTNESQAIEIAYDLQSGSYIDAVNSNPDITCLYAKEIANILGNFVNESDSLLDIGSGELTTLTLVLNEMTVKPKNILALDISWSRLIKGKVFFDSNILKEDLGISPFVADIKDIPLRRGCVDVVTSSHALEPNRGNLSCLLKELFKVAKKKLILFEPSYELNSEEGRKRMDRHGYIRGIQSTAENLGGRVIEIIPIKNVGNPLNPTACYIIEPPSLNTDGYKEKPVFCVPGTNFVLEEKEGFLVSEETGLAYPVLRNIPILKNQYGILATAIF